MIPGAERAARSDVYGRLSLDLQTRPGRAPEWIASVNVLPVARGTTQARRQRQGRGDSVFAAVRELVARLDEERL